MKTYRKATTKDGRQSDTHVIVDIDGKPYEVITQAKHPEKWAEYEASLTASKPKDEAPASPKEEAEPKSKSKEKKAKK
jgi:hypothetical protein